MAISISIYIVHSKTVLTSLNSLEGEECKGYLAHFKLSLSFFFATCLLLTFSTSGCLMDNGEMNV